MKKDGNEKELNRYIELTQWIRELSNPKIAEIESDDNYRAVMLKNFSRIGELSRINVELLDELYFPLMRNDRVLSAGEQKMVKEFADALMNPYTQDNLDIHIVYLQLEHMLKTLPKDADLRIRILDDFVMVSFSMMYTAVCVYPCSDIFKKYRAAGISAAKEILVYLEPQKFATLKTDEAKESVLITSRYIRALYERPDAPGDSAQNREELDTLRKSRALADDPFYIANAPAYDWKYHVFRINEYVAGLSEFNNVRGFDKGELEEVYDFSRRAKEMYESDPAYFSALSEFNNIKMPYIRNQYLTGRITPETYKRELEELFAKRRLTETGQQDLSAIMIVTDYMMAVDKNNISEKDARVLGRMYHELIWIMNAHARRGTLMAMMFYLSAILKNYVEIPGGASFETFCIDLMAALHPPTYVHTLNVAALSKILATHLLKKMPEQFAGMPGYETAEDVLRHEADIIDYVYHAALCHDFGKLIIIETIRTYGRRLLPPEMEMIWLHASVGAYLLEQYEDTKQYADVARGHHRWYDNRAGYPDAFDVQASPYKTAIALVTCADCLDAATDTVGRSYKEGKDFDVFFDELCEESGTRYAPYLRELLSDSAVRADLETQLANGREDNYREAYRRLKSHKMARQETEEAYLPEAVPPARSAS